MASTAIIKTLKLTTPWQTLDPFLFCVHHLDNYPKGDGKMGPSLPLQGRELGNDFSGKSGFSMYHGSTVPGFPVHPHRGFETVTVGRRGFIDHFDSLGGYGRFGNGDTQWMTAGKGVQHSEMFPLVHTEKENPTELFQVWLNLPRKNKFVDPEYKMLWHEDIPIISYFDDDQRLTQIDLIAGQYGKIKALPPTNASWAADPDNEVSIWTIKMAANAIWALPAGSSDLNRCLYFYAGAGLKIDGELIPVNHRVDLISDKKVTLSNSSNTVVEILLLQGRPINEPVVQHGPFVMNTTDEIYKTFADYRKTNFGGWPWPSSAPVNPQKTGRFSNDGQGNKEVR
ncbi:Pirin domain-containing protein [Psychromonas ingrahamii 37]|uniref:Pirin domain-containing protein n=1 Tax=Psychromonas ingrahamii (strain DSM 17664 / CCUG 51855 / 37) TaxID=357804 RepID=A1SXY7_PSYIN|nr:pirin family protein [Psychromonas ingrahamii]ABM04352.1 Pirin domain-containing protein [Psychromonas ingrahamii 37]